ncbi:fimbrial protein [Burkholderia ubonensis]|uniref:fimbrial protein n=1 Tax=Burkholderia ubonensis TaxID=101571 RepID=UPI000AE361AA|nr:fimbrial protein [Burkholderia ubonensis]
MHRQTYTQYRSALSRRGMIQLRMAMIGAMLLLGGGWSVPAEAVCKLIPGTVAPPSQLRIPALPATTTLKPAAIGAVMASYRLDIVSYSYQTEWTCQDGVGDRWGMGALTTTLALQDESRRVYETGVPGIGIRIGFSGYYSPWVDTFIFPFERNAWGGSSGTGYTPFSIVTRMLIEFVRTGMEVGKGPMTPFNLSTDYHISTNPQTRIPITGTQLTTTLVQNFYYTSCYNPAPPPTVNLGRVSAWDLKKGNVTQQDFSLDIRCDGMNPTTKPAVKIYFAGNSPRDGLLLTDGQGQAGMAQGVGVALTDSNGTDLPFAKERALTTTWTSSGTNTELYRFRGKARYVASGGEVKAGRADATLTYILQYN